jgi:predicted outer membrane repeat protein
MRTASLFILWILAVPMAAADNVVTLCHIDAEVGVVPGSLPPRNLRDAVAAGGGVTFACPPNTVIHITKPLDVASVTEIDGGNKITLDEAGTSQILTVNGGPDGRNLVVRNLIIQGGKPTASPNSGAVGIIFSGTLGHSPSNATFDHVIIKNTERPIFLALGNLVIKDSQFVTNTGEVVHIGLHAGDSVSTLIVESASLSISNSTFDRNAGSAVVSSGAAVTMNGVTVTGRSDSTDRNSQFIGGIVNIRNSHFNNLWSGSLCGGALQSTATTSISTSSFTGNRSDCGGGAVYISGAAQNVRLSSLKFDNNQTQGRGGAISFDDLDTTIDFQYGSFHNNHAGVGGALAISIGDTRPHPVFTGGALSFKNNSSTQNGGAAYSHGAQFQLTRGIFLENKPGTGGTLSISGAPFLLANLLVARNSGAAGIETSIDGQLINSTIADNDGVGLLLNAQLRATNTVVSNNHKQNCQFAGSVATFLDGGSNYQFPGMSCSSTIPSQDPMLDNFYVPDPKSPLQSAGQNAVCLASPVFARDVYGQRRPRSSQCSVGAVEGDIAQLIHHLDDVGPSFSAPRGLGSLIGVGGSSRSSFVRYRCYWLLLFFLLLMLLTILFIWLITKLRHHKD